MIKGDFVVQSHSTSKFNSAAPAINKPVIVSGVAIGNIDAINYRLTNNTFHTSASIYAGVREQKLTHESFSLLHEISSGYSSLMQSSFSVVAELSAQNYQLATQQSSIMKPGHNRPLELALNRSE